MSRFDTVFWSWVRAAQGLAGGLHCCMKRTANAASGLLAVLLALLPAAAMAGGLTCECKAPSCGNGAVSAQLGKVFRDVPAVSLERMFGPSRTGEAKTGWECSDGPRPTATAPAPAQPSAPDPNQQALFTCTCTKEKCGGPGTMPGQKGEQQGALSKSFVLSLFQPQVTGPYATGWQCADGHGTAVAPTAAPAEAATATGPIVTASTRYTCTCTKDLCGGKDGFTEAERGQKHTGIASARLSGKYGPELTGAQATGWACQPDGPVAKFSCTCSRESCAGKGGVLPGERGQKHTGISETKLAALYGPERTQDQATGWTCTEEKPEVAKVPAASSGPAAQPYVCRCDGLLGCGAGGAQPGKRGETHHNVPAAKIRSVYHSEVAGGWVCTAVPLPPPVNVLPVGVDPGYVCRCVGAGGCGAKNTPMAPVGAVREGVPLAQINTMYQSDQQINGWRCTRPANTVISGPGLDPGYVCRCQAKYGCFDAQGKFGEVRSGIPESHLQTLYNESGHNSWACTLK